MAQYLKNKEFYNEICISLEQKKLTKKAEGMLILLAERANQKLKYNKNSKDKEDCIAFAILDLFNYWDRFDPSKTTNAFAYFTQIAKNGYAKGWNKLYPVKYKGTMSIEGSSDNDGIYSI